MILVKTSTYVRDQDLLRLQKISNFVTPTTHKNER